MQACASGQLNAVIAAVGGNKSTAPILEKGSSLGLGCLTMFVISEGFAREEHDAEVTSTTFWSGQRLNVSPSHLSRYAGGWI